MRLISEEDGTGIRKNQCIAVTVLLLLALCVYGRSIGFDFLATWDDDVYIMNNGAATGFSLPNIAAAFTSFFVGNYAPLQIISYMADYTVWGLNPAGFHLTNIVLHAANGIALYLLMTRLELSVLSAAAASALFIIHPVQVETVAWVSERKNILGLLFMLLSLHAWHSWREHAGEKKGTRYYGLALAFFLCSLLAKASITAVFPLLLAAYTRGYDTVFPPRKFLAGVSPFVALSLLFSIVAFIAQSAEFAGGRAETAKGGWFFTMPPVFAKYIGLIIFPNGLLPSYLPVYRESADTAVVLSLVLLAALGVMASLLIRKERKFLFWVSCIILPMLPVSQIIPFVTQMNDRYLYFPLTGLAGVTALLTDKAILQGGATAKRIVVALAVVLTVVLGGIACRQTGIWKNDVVLWSHLIEKSPPTPLYFWRLGEAYRFSGNPSAAVAAYYRSLELNPDYAKAHLGAAEALLQAGRPAEALNHALVIVRKFPARPLGFTLMGEAYLQLGERDKAESALSRAIRLSPRDSRTVAALKMLAR